METNKDGFEIATCGRCGGSGEHSFNLLHGSRCYGCGGSGKTFTARALKAKAFYKTSCMRSVDEVQAGEFIRGSNSGKWRRITEIDRSDKNGSINGVPFIAIRYAGMSECVTAGRMVESVRNEDERKAKLAAAIEYQSKL